MNRLFFAKILLFGEYTIILNSDALTVPLTKFSACLHIPSRQEHPYTEVMTDSNKKLWSFFAFLKSRFGREYFNTDQFEEDLLQGLYLRSGIPVNYGLGSSGALVAAVYDRYFINQESTDKPDGLMRLKDLFAQIESYFHGRSSGIDPLSCYMGFPLHFTNIQNVNEIQLKFSLRNMMQHFFLFDSKQTAETGPLVQLFLEKIREPEYYIRLQQKLIPSVNEAIQAFLLGDFDYVRENFKAISTFQLKNMPEMIPDKFKSIWEEGLNHDDYYLKLCGSGGGGYLLGIKGKNSQINEIFDEQSLLQL
jgi:mevalonate kinase